MKQLISILVLAFIFIVSAFSWADLSSHKIKAESSQNKAVVGLNLGNEAPEIDLKDPNGEVIKLSSLRGKLVLIDFWASWCGPCRKENPSVVKAYHQFKDIDFKTGKGFTVYSVSLDGNVDAWKKAIEKDGLVWSAHVSDLQGWNNVAAAKYGIGSIPSNFLINDKGIIIQKDLRGEQLIAFLEKLSQDK